MSNNYDNKINDSVKEIQMLYMESCQSKNKPMLFEKKLQNYTKCNILIDEAIKLISDLDSEIKNMDIQQISPLHLNAYQSRKIDEYIDMLSTTNPKIDEILEITNQLRAISKGLPMTCEIIDNIEQEVIYEETEIQKID